MAEYRIKRETTTVEESSIIYSGPCVLERFWIGGLDGVNDPSVEIFNGTDDTGDIRVPTNDYDASQKGLNGSAVCDQDCPDGIYVKITPNGGTCSVSLVWSRREAGRSYR